MWPSDHQTCTSSTDGPSPLSPLLHHHCVATLKGHTSYTSALPRPRGGTPPHRLLRQAHHRPPRPQNPSVENRPPPPPPENHAARQSNHAPPPPEPNPGEKAQDVHVDAVSLLYSVSWDRSLKIWRTAEFKCLESVADARGEG